MDDRETVRADWENKGVYRLLDELYSEIWVYGRQSIYDAVKEYAIPASVQPKIYFTGYLPRKTTSAKTVKKVRKKFCVKNGEAMGPQSTTTNVIGLSRPHRSAVGP